MQELLFTENKHQVVIVSQAMDIGGKYGNIRRIFSDFNPQGVCVASFKVPSQEELSHDYLWNIHEIVSSQLWSKHFGQINDFERLLAEKGLNCNTRQQKKIWQA